MRFAQFASLTVLISTTLSISLSQVALCLAIHGTPNHPGQITIQSDDPSPVLIFRHRNLTSYPNLPDVASYQSQYSTNKEELYRKVVDSDKNEFILGADATGDLNTHITKEGVIFSATEKGIYCVYVAPQDTSQEISVSFRHSYGTRPYLDHQRASAYKYVFLVALGMAVYLMYYILRFKVGDDFSNLGSISVISRGIIFLLLLPYSVLMLVCSVAEGISGHVSPLWVWRLTIFEQWALTSFAHICNFFLLLLSMGVGVVYYPTENRRNLRVLPQSLWYKAVAFLMVELVCNVFVLFSKPAENTPYSPHMPYLVSDSLTAINMSFLSIPQAIAMLASLVQFVVTVYYFFQTKKLIKTFPASTDDADANIRIERAYRNTIFVLFVWPLVMAVVGVISLGKISADPLDGIEEVVFRGSGVEMYVGFFVQVMGIFLIWIRDNNGLIVEQLERSES